MSAISHVDTIMFVFTMYSYLQLNLQFVALIVEECIILISNKWMLISISLSYKMVYTAFNLFVSLIFYHVIRMLRKSIHKSLAFFVIDQRPNLPPMLFITTTLTSLIYHSHTIYIWSIFFLRLSNKFVLIRIYTCICVNHIIIKFWTAKLQHIFFASQQISVFIEDLYLQTFKLSTFYLKFFSYDWTH